MNRKKIVGKTVGAVTLASIVATMGATSALANTPLPPDSPVSVTVTNDTPEVTSLDKSVSDYYDSKQNAEDMTKKLNEVRSINQALIEPLPGIETRKQQVSPNSGVGVDPGVEAPMTKEVKTIVKDKDSEVTVTSSDGESVTHEKKTVIDAREPAKGEHPEARTSNPSLAPVANDTEQARDAVAAVGVTDEVKDQKSIVSMVAMIGLILAGVILGFFGVKTAGRKKATSMNNDSNSSNVDYTEKS